MAAVEALHHEHRLLRAKITLARKLLDAGSSAGSLTEVCTTLCEELHQHAAHEQRLVIQHQLLLMVTPAQMPLFVIEHRAQAQQLRVLSRLLLRQSTVSLAWVRRMLAKTLDELVGHMQEQEDRLFPLFQRQEMHPENHGVSWNEGNPAASWVMAACARH